MTGGQQEQPFILVGIGSRSTSPTALRWAVEQAERTGCRVIAVRPWKAPTTQATPSGTSAGRVPVVAQSEQQARREFEQQVADLLGPDHRVEVRLVRGGRASVWLEASNGAALLVVDAPKERASQPLLPQRLVYNATCPVVVIPPSISEEPDTALTRASRAVGREALRSAGTAGRPGYRRPVTRTT